jgi:uncharacterized protein DUF4383
MAHLPINHHLQPLYRVLAAGCGGYVLIFGAVGLLRTGGLDLFAQQGLPSSLGLRANGAFAAISVVAGAVLLFAAFRPRLGHFVNLVAGVVFLTAGIAMMALLRTDLNVLGFSMATCVVSFVIGLVLLTAGLYGKVGSPQSEQLEERIRHGAGSAAAG